MALVQLLHLALLCSDVRLSFHPSLDRADLTASSAFISAIVRVYNKPRAGLKIARTPSDSGMPVR